MALVVIATACYGLAINIAAPIQQQYGSIAVMARMLALATLWTAPLGIVGATASTFEWAPFLAIAVAGVLGTGIAFVFMGNLVGRVGSTRASVLTYLIPVVALILGVVFRGDVVAPVAVAGVVMVTAGAALASRRDTSSPRSVPGPAEGLDTTDVQPKNLSWGPFGSYDGREPIRNHEEL